MYQEVGAKGCCPAKAIKAIQGKKDYGLFFITFFTPHKGKMSYFISLSDTINYIYNLNN